MKIRVSRFAVVLLAGAYLYSFTLTVLAQSPQAGEELFLSSNQVGHYGGHLVVSLRSEPKTLNPVTSLDISSREVIAQMTGDLIHINRLTQDTEPALAKTWQVSPTGSSTLSTCATDCVFLTAIRLTPMTYSLVSRSTWMKSLGRLNAMG